MIQVSAAFGETSICGKRAGPKAVALDLLLTTGGLAQVTAQEEQGQLINKTRSWRCRTYRLGSGPIVALSVTLFHAPNSQTSVT